MSEQLTDESWYQLLNDLDKYHDYCNMLTFGAPHVDFIGAVMYQPNQDNTHFTKRKQWEAKFHFKKLQLYQNIPYGNDLSK